ncbi:hypothetical protein N8I71_00440 [Roseibacterium sp. SDUM158016]|uniref:hypothetical protein n=1 Tax=Roseicyclus sediminis TaxID=2980997 RepID=UPI0021D13961|nr:hypothetical protein [Roseibacterium sp. SDUM158016]MCU4651282.1 hypothetical protein [Roseibacterium sp. SDUM158016]
MQRLIPAAVLAAALLPAPALADDITDALNAAIAAYEGGEIQDALAEIAYATQLLNDLQSEGLAAFLPAALDGWTRELSDDAAQGLGFMGGGSAAEAVYTGPEGEFTIVMVADNPMVGAMAGMLGNPALMQTMGRIARIGGESFLDADGELAGLIGGRVLIQASGVSVATMSAHLEQIDFDALADFGR